jgi:hypothetical protein
MRIEIAGSERDMAPAQPLRRVAPAGRVGGARDAMPRRSPGPIRPRGGARGGGRGGRGGGREGKERGPPKTKDELDAEMDAYMSTKAA